MTLSGFTSGSANRSEVAYERLRAGILSGRWRPGTTLSTYGLAEELEMSRTPVLGALKRLQTDGLLEIVPQVGCRILPRAHEQTSETFMIRAALEAVSAELAAARITDEELASLERVVTAADEAAAADDHDRYEMADRDFHMGILSASHAVHLQRILQGLWTLSRYQLAASRFIGTRMDLSRREHRMILDALRAHDADAARDAMQVHLRKCSMEYLEFVKANGGAPLEAVGATTATD